MNFNIPIHDLMNEDLITVSADAPLADFVSHFDRRGIHHLLVENKNAELIGIISKLDLSKKFSTLELSQIQARHVMTDKPKTVSSDISLIEAIKIFLKENFRALPVLNANNKLVGILTPYDILNYNLRAFENDFK